MWARAIAHRAVPRGSADMLSAVRVRPSLHTRAMGEGDGRGSGRAQGGGARLPFHLITYQIMEAY